MDGDQTRGLLPLFTRKKRGPGWEYQLVLNPEALLEGRRSYQRVLDELKNAIAGRTSKRRGPIRVLPEHEPLAEALRRRKAESDKKKVLDEIDEDAWAKNNTNWEKEIDTLARKIVPQYRQHLPGKHGER